MSGHGWVKPNPDGSKARCGGPGLCRECSRELTAANSAALATRPPMPRSDARPTPWRPIATASHLIDPVWVWAAPYQDLPGFACIAVWHPDAGWCVDELRQVTHWAPIVKPRAGPGGEPLGEWRHWAARAGAGQGIEGDVPLAEIPFDA